MNTTDAQRLHLEHVCAAWETATAVLPISDPVACTSGIVLAGADADPRFCYISIGSPLETLLSRPHTIADRNGAALSVAELADRLLAGNVAGVLAPRGPAPQPSGTEPAAPVLPETLIERRREIRRDNVLARFLIRQIGLEEVSSYRGASPKLFQSLAAVWSRDLALAIDPAMLLTLGADRQRHVDADHADRARELLPRTLRRLQDIGVHSYPRLVII